jgi:hypothetical protein
MPLEWSHWISKDRQLKKPPRNQTLCEKPRHGRPAFRHLDSPVLSHSRETSVAGRMLTLARCSRLLTQPAPAKLEVPTLEEPKNRQSKNQEPDGFQM